MMYPYPAHVAPALVFLVGLLTAQFPAVVPGATLEPYDGYRTLAEQAAYFAQGRKPLDEVNRLRKQAGLALIGTTDNAHKITWARPGESTHNDNPSIAVDVVIRCHGVRSWNPRLDCDRDGIPDYQEMGEYAEELGLLWGGRWKQRDLSHLEIP